MPRSDGTPYASEVGAANLGKVFIVVESGHDHSDNRAVFLDKDQAIFWVEKHVAKGAETYYHVEEWNAGISTSPLVYNVERKPGPVVLKVAP